MKLDFSSGKTNVFLVFLGLAIVTSFTSKLVSTYEKNIDFTVFRLPNDKILIDQYERCLKLRIYLIYRYYFKNPELKFR